MSDITSFSKGSILFSSREGFEIEMTRTACIIFGHRMKEIILEKVPNWQMRT